MSSPFPGMDPYLEVDALWPTFHHGFVQTLHEVLRPSLLDRYQLCIKQRNYVSEETQSPAVAEKEHHEDYIEIRQRSDGRLISLVDTVSPANKLTTAGRAAYLEQRREGKNANANLVEIDLVLQGKPMLEYTRDGLPAWDYAVTVTRSAQPERYEIYTATLQKHLPRFRIPLASDDRDTVLDLNAAFTRCYDQGGFARQIDYQRDPPVPLSEENQRWINDLLTSQRLRAPAPKEEEIARTAYFLWEQEGRVHGRHEDHWHRAIELLKQQKRAGASGPSASGEETHGSGAEVAGISIENLKLHLNADGTLRRSMERKLFQRPVC